MQGSQLMLGWLVSRDHCESAHGRLVKVAGRSLHLAASAVGSAKGDSRHRQTFAGKTRMARS